MELLHQYYFHKGKITAKAIAYAFLSVLFVGIGVFCFVHWDLSFMFTDWKGYMMIAVYGLITLGTILSTIDLFRKISKAYRGIPALAVGADFFVLYDRHGLATTIPFEDCERVRFKKTYKHRAFSTLKLIILYHSKAEPMNTNNVEFELSELDRPQREIDKQLNNVYKKYKKEHDTQTR